MNMGSGRWVAAAITDITKNSPLSVSQVSPEQGQQKQRYALTTAAALQILVLRLKMICQAANSQDWNTDTRTSLSHLQLFKFLVEGSCCELGDQYWGSETCWRANLCRQATTLTYIGWSEQAGTDWFRVRNSITAEYAQPILKWRSCVKLIMLS